MAPPKKGTKMDLGSFLADDSLGGNSWADEEVDLNTIAVSVTTSAVPETSGGSFQSQGPSSNFSSMGGGFRGEQRERKEYPVPDQPPYRAKVSNLPWEIDEAAIGQYFEDVMDMPGAIEDIELPRDRDSGRVKGFAFVTFKKREVLEESLKVSTSEFQGRRIFVNVAAPPRNNAFDGDWRSSRSGPLGGGREPREEPVLDWGAARNSQASLPQRDFPNRSDRPRRERPQRDEPDLDWGAARGQSELPPRERPERADRPPRRERPQKDEPELDWGSARGQGALPPRERSFRKKPEPEFDWSRGQSIPARKPARAANSEDAKNDDQPKPQKSSFSVLAVDDDDELTQEQEKPAETKPEQTTGLEAATANLSVADSEGWEVVGK
jgi:translation initiation factor 4B